MASDVPQGFLQFRFCDMNFQGRGNSVKHERHCKNNPDVHIWTESPGSAQKRTARIPVLPEQRVKNPASDYAEGGINDDLQKVPLTLMEILAATILCTLKTRGSRRATCSDDEPGTSNLDDGAAANNPDQVLTTCSDKSSSSVEYYGGDEMRRVTARPILRVEDDDLNRNVGCQGVTGCVDDSDLQKQKRKPDLSVADLRDLVEMQQQNVKADINIRDREHPSVMKIQNEKVDLNLLPHKNRSDHEVPTLSVSSVDDPDALVSTDTNSDKEIETVNSGIDINIPEQRESSVMQMQKEKLGLNLPPRNDSSGHEVPTLSVSSTDDLTSLAPTDTISDKDTNSNVADSFIHCPEQE